MRREAVVLSREGSLVEDALVHKFPKWTVTAQACLFTYKRESTSFSYFSSLSPPSTHSFGLPSRLFTPSCANVSSGPTLSVIHARDPTRTVYSDFLSLVSLDSGQLPSSCCPGSRGRLSHTRCTTSTFCRSDPERFHYDYQGFPPILREHHYQPQGADHVLNKVAFVYIKQFQLDLGTLASAARNSSQHSR